MTHQISPRTRWERVAATKWGAYISAVEERAIRAAHRLSLENFGRAESALEIGCEGGRWSRLLADLGWTMTCTDVNAEALAACRERLPAANCVLVEGSETRLPLQPKSVQLLLCIEVSPVINAPWFVDEAFRVLDDNGVVAGMFWNRLSLRGLYGRLKSALLGSGNCYQHSYVKWQEGFSRFFEINHEEGCCWFPFPRESDSPLVPHFAELEQRAHLHRCIPFSPFVAFVAAKRAANAR